jgi:uncharacterized Ntn-hydrolase superfamily protein
VSGEVGSAGATCGDSVVWPGTKGALVISDVLPGVGAIHTQALYLFGNKLNARTRMEAGDSPEEIIAWLIKNDVAGDSTVRQYGVVDYNNGSPRAYGFTGSKCMNYKNHIVGPNYSIQGNILLGPQILDSMEARFNRETGCLADKLMAAMQGANVVGADTRCTVEGTSSLSSFLRVAQADNRSDSLYIDLVIAGTPFLVEPIDSLQNMFNDWKRSNRNPCAPVGSINRAQEKSAFPIIYDAENSRLILETIPRSADQFRLMDMRGVTVASQDLDTHQHELHLGTGDLREGIYFVIFYSNSHPIFSKKVLIY